jgi:hypothetical protein
MLFTIAVTGYLNGSLYYWGTPALEDRSTLTAADLQMALETRKMLDSIEPGLWNTVDKKLTPLVRQALRIGLNDVLAQIKTGLNGRHRKADLTVEMTVSQLEPTRTYSIQQAVVVELLGDGTAALNGRVKAQADLQDHQDMAPSPKDAPAIQERPSLPSGT